MWKNLWPRVMGAELFLCAVSEERRRKLLKQLSCFISFPWLTTTPLWLRWSSMTPSLSCSFNLYIQPSTTMCASSVRLISSPQLTAFKLSASNFSSVDDYTELPLVQLVSTPSLHWWSWCRTARPSSICWTSGLKYHTITLHTTAK